MEPFIGTIQPFGFNFAPKSWATCSGQLLPISQNAALFSLLGTAYGGNGQSTFALPDLRGRLPMSMGNGPGLTPRVIGEASGVEQVTATINNLPAHTHAATATLGVQVAGTASNPVTTPSATNNILGASGTGPASAAIWSDALTNPVNMGGINGSSVTVSSTGGSLPMDVMNPYLVLNFCIALYGVFPSRN